MATFWLSRILLIILALDALDIYPVRRYDCKSLRQIRYGQVNVSEYKILRTVALWASFLTGEKIDEEIPFDKETQWLFQLTPQQTFLHLIDRYHTIDVPSFSFKQHNHAKERQLMREAFADEACIDDFDTTVWRHHDENKKELFQSLGHYDLVMGYFDLVDAVGHLSYGVSRKMKEAYRELDSIAKEVRSSFEDAVLIVSDHGMRPLGRYGEHYGYGFFSTNYRSQLHLPRITDFREEITRVATELRARV